MYNCEKEETIDIFYPVWKDKTLYWALNIANDEETIFYTGLQDDVGIYSAHILIEVAKLREMLDVAQLHPDCFHQLAIPAIIQSSNYEGKIFQPVLLLDCQYPLMPELLLRFTNEYTDVDYYMEIETRLPVRASELLNYLNNMK